MTIEQAKEVLENHTQHFVPTEDIHALNMAIKSLEAWDKVKKDILSRSIIKTHTESYESGFSDGLESAFDTIEEHLEEVEE